MKSTLLLTVAVATLAAALVLGVVRWNFVRRAQAAPGVVSAQLFGGSHVQVRFALPDHREVMFAQGGLVFGLEPGRQVKILYLADDPEGSACVDSLGAVWAGPLLLAAIGTVLAAVSLQDRG